MVVSMSYWRVPLVDEMATVAMRQEHKGRDPLRDQLVYHERDDAVDARETDGERPGVAIEGDVEDAPVLEFFAAPWYSSVRAPYFPAGVPALPIYLTCKPVMCRRVESHTKVTVLGANANPNHTIGYGETQFPQVLARVKNL